MPLLAITSYHIRAYKNLATTIWQVCCHSLYSPYKALPECNNSTHSYQQNLPWIKYSYGEKNCNRFGSHHSSSICSSDLCCFSILSTRKGELHNIILQYQSGAFDIHGLRTYRVLRMNHQVVFKLLPYKGDSLDQLWF